MLTTAVLYSGVLNSAALNSAVLREPGGHYGGGGMAWGGGPGWFLLLIPLFWVLVIGIFIAIFGRRWRRNGAERAAAGQQWHAGADSRSAEKTLAERFAQGDIDEVEYRARLEVLRANRAGGPPAV